MIVDTKEYDTDVSLEMEVIDDVNSELNEKKEKILDGIAESDGFFKSQQVGEEDLTFSEKRQIAGELLSSNVPLFLQRYWKYIHIDNIDYFGTSEDYEVNFYLDEIRKCHNSRTNKARIRNRRYEALKQMVKEGTYFSDSEMKNRNPFLYDQLVGQYLTENEKMEEYKKIHKDDRFSNFLMGQFERNVENRLFEKQKEEDECVIEEEDDDSSDSEESELEDDEPQKPSVTEQERLMLRNEFTNIMYEHFLAGKDKEFDYSSVDNNVEYDPVQQRTLDEEEKYFDED